MAFELFIGRRYLRSKQKQVFISLITILSIAGVTVGVMALITVIAVMAGAEAYFKSCILGVESHVVLMQHGGRLADYPGVLADIEKNEGVEAATPFINTQVMLRSSFGVSGAVLRGVDPFSASKVIKVLDGNLLPDQLGKDKAENSITPGIILGKELAKNLGVMKGDELHVISLSVLISPFGIKPAPSMKRFKVTGIFESGMYEYDGNFSYIHLDDAQKILHMDSTVTGIEIRVTDVENAKSIAEKIVGNLGSPFWARDWMQMNHNFFSALELEKKAMFIILVLIELVAAFNITSSLIMMVMEKKRDIGILKAMGAKNKSIRKIFIFKGMVIGSIGTVLGGCMGYVLCSLLENYKIKMPGDVYNFINLPVNLQLSDVFMIGSSALIICFFATLYPAHQASKIDPVEAIRNG